MEPFEIKNWIITQATWSESDIAWVEGMGCKAYVDGTLDQMIKVRIETTTAEQEDMLKLKYDERLVFKNSEQITNNWQRFARGYD